MPINSPQAGRNQLQAMLEQMYQRNAMNASPGLRTPMLNDATKMAQFDAGNYRPPSPSPNYAIPPGMMQRPSPTAGGANMDYMNMARQHLLKQRNMQGGGIIPPGEQQMYAPRIDRVPGTDPTALLNRLRERTMGRKINQTQSLPTTL